MKLHRRIVLLGSVWVAGSIVTGGGVRVLQDAHVTPVQKVIQLLNSMILKGKEEKHKEEVAFSKFKEFCGLTRTAKIRSISTAADQCTEFEAAIATAEADADKLGERVAHFDADIAGWETEEKSASAVRRKEHATYEATNRDYEESISALEHALAVLKSKQADVPQGQSTPAALTELLEQAAASSLPPTAKQALVSLTQGNTAESDGAPEANAYEFQSGGVVQLLEKLRQRFLEEHRALQREELSSRHVHEMLLHGLRDDGDYAAAARQKSVATRAARLRDAAVAKGDLGEARARKSADETYLRDLNANCHTRSQEFEARQVLRASELEAIHKATEILSSPEVAGAAEKHLPAALLQRQPSLVQLQSSGAAAGTPARARAASLLAERAGHAHSSLLATIAGRVAEDPFVKVRKMIQDLLARLMEEANEEADHKGWCDTELSANKMSRENLGAEVERLTSHVDELSALKAKLGQEIGDLSDEIASIDASVAKATAERKEEKANNVATLEDAKVAQVAVLQAIRALKDFYGAAAQPPAFLQGRQVPDKDAPATWDADYVGMQGESTGVLGMLDVVRSDFARLEAQTSSSEDEAEREYGSLMADSEQDKAVKDQAMRRKGFKKDSTQRELSSAKKELEDTNNELSSAMVYYDKLKPSCVDTGLSYEDRAARRKEEISSLQEALRILEGEDLSAPAA